MCLKKLWNNIYTFLSEHPLGLMLWVIPLIATVGLFIISFFGVFKPPDPNKPIEHVFGTEIATKTSVTMELIYKEGSWKVYRTGVPNGWVVFTSRGITYVPDPEHNWRLDE